MCWRFCSTPVGGGYYTFVGGKLPEEQPPKFVYHEQLYHLVKLQLSGRRNGSVPAAKQVTRRSFVEPYLFKPNSIKMAKKFLSLFFVILFALAAFAQSGPATGTVKDANNEPLIGVRCSVKGTQTGVFTDLDGRFFPVPLLVKDSA